MNNYITVEIERSSIPQEMLESVKVYAINEYSCLGVEEFDLSEMEVDAILGERSYSGGDLSEEVLNEVEETFKSKASQNDLIKFFFLNTEETEIFSEFIKDNFGEVQILVNNNIGPKDWNEEWRKHYTSINVDGVIEIVPSWEKETHSTSLIPIYIYPGMGFGTGGHETTSMCLSLLISLKDKKMINCLDFGCGSGILGLAFKKIYENSEVSFFDIDYNAIENTKQNLLQNDLKLEDGIKLFVGDTWTSTDKFDVVFANILAGTLIELRFEISKTVAKNGSLILSGILNEQVDEVIKKYNEIGFKVEKETHKNAWAAILLRRE